MSVLAVGLRRRREQRLFDLEGRLARRKTRSVGDPEDMRVDANSGLAKYHVEDNVCGFATNARERLERRAVSGDLAAVLLDKLTGKPIQVL